jgi:hypothetical protein
MRAPAGKEPPRRKQPQRPNPGSISSRDCKPFVHRALHPLSPELRLPDQRSAFRTVAAAYLRSLATAHAAARERRRPPAAKPSISQGRIAQRPGSPRPDRHLPQRTGAIGRHDRAIPYHKILNGIPQHHAASAGSAFSHAGRPASACCETFLTRRAFKMHGEPRRVSQTC